MAEKKKKLSGPNIPDTPLPDIRSDIMFANGMSRNQVMKDPELRKLYNESLREAVETKNKRTDQEKLRELLDKRNNNGRKS